ncbi:hypothetical protein STAS_04812 [Striga asiatica]|uniref:Uncharacterized protein n=1 Tax=Striga asiatica TaxID=4170 RepID=A0A5A7P917_STRAF|nr:hypothetical protein STAS_04812 [Striga asiatica]
MEIIESAERTGEDNLNLALVRREAMDSENMESHLNSIVLRETDDLMEVMPSSSQKLTKEASGKIGKKANGAGWKRRVTTGGRLSRISETFQEEENITGIKRSRELKQFQITVRNGAKTKISECNWVPGLNGGSPTLKAEINGSLFWVKDLLIAGGLHWDSTLIKALFEERDANLILQINTLNPNVADKWRCSFQGKGKGKSKHVS